VEKESRGGEKSQGAAARSRVVEQDRGAGLWSRAE